MKGLHVNIEQETLKNTDFRRVLYTGKHSQLVVMVLHPLEDIGMEVHKGTDQFFRFEEGEGKVIIDGVAHPVTNGDAIVVPAGAQHDVVNTSKAKDLKLYTIYSPPEHKDGCRRHTKDDAVNGPPEHFDGKTTE